MKKKTKKAAKKPRPKTVTKIETVEQWRVVNRTDKWLSSNMTKHVACEMVASLGDPYYVARVTITYEVRR